LGNQRTQHAGYEGRGAQTGKDSRRRFLRKRIIILFMAQEMVEAGI
jgi:hypothetical protein